MAGESAFQFWVARELAQVYVGALQFLLVGGAILLFLLLAGLVDAARAMAGRRRHRKPTAASSAATRCTIPPAGWRCTRVAGHTGPCAAVPDPDRRL